MKKLLAFICLCIQIVPIMGQSVLRTSHGVKVETKAACVELECFSSSIIRVKKYPLGQAPEKQSLSVTMQPEKVKYKIQEANNQVILTTSELTVLLDIVQNRVRFVTKDGKELLAEKPSSTGFTSSMMQVILHIGFAKLSCWIVMRLFMVWDSTNGEK